MQLKVYQVDAFAGSLFKGNPAAVVILEKEIPDESTGYRLKTKFAEIDLAPTMRQTAVPALHHLAIFCAFGL